MKKLSIASPQEWLRRARAKEFALAGFAAYNMETVQAVVEVADELSAPVLIQTTGPTIRNAGIEYLSAIVRTAAEQVKVPVILHLDHGQSLEQVVQCLRHGYTSVMVDGSSLPLADNIALTRRVVEIAHAVGVAVEAELGHVGGVEDDLTELEAEAAMTDPALALEFVEATQVDSLAVAIGTAHGLYKGEPHLDFARLEAIAAKTAVPLVLHGASGVPEEAIRRAVTLGIAKFNIATELKLPFAEALRDYFRDHPGELDPRKFLPVAKRAYQAVVRAKIEMSGSAGQA